MGVGGDEKGDYSARWAEYRRRRNIFLLVFVTYVPGTLLFGSTISRLFDNEKGFFVVAICWMAAFVGTSIQMTSWECPRCGKWFHAKWWMGNLFAGKCVHCGLRKWADSADDERRVEDF